MAYKDHRKFSTSMDRLTWRKRGSIFMPRLLRNCVAGLGLLTVFWICLWQLGHSMDIVMVSGAAIAKSPFPAGTSQLTEAN